MTNLCVLNEEWKPVVGYEGFYEVSNKGQIRSLDRRRGKRQLKGNPMKVWKRVNKYPRVCLANFDGKSKSHMVHRLVALAFIPNPLDKPTVNHIDGNKLNNCVENLEWNTISENQKHAFRTGLATVPDLKFGEDHPASKLSNVDVEMIKVLAANDFRNNQIAKRFNIHETHVSAIKLNKTRKQKI